MIRLGAITMRELLAELREELGRGRSCAWCSVVETRGSTPQKAGATMLVFADGSQRGTLGGGCVEAEVRQQTLRLLAHDGTAPELLTYCLDDDYGWDDGLICGGRMSVLADPVRSPAATSYFRHLSELIEAGRGCTEAVILSPEVGAPVGSRYLFDADGRVVAQTVDGPVPEAIIASLVPLARRPMPRTQRGVAFLPVLSRVTLVIVGGGHVGHAVGRLAAEVDFDVWVLDDRAAYANRERFPNAQRLLVGEIGPSLRELAPTLDPSCYCLIVTRGHNHDEEALYHLAPTSAGYVGMIGSKRKIKLIYEDLIAKGLTTEQLARVRAPVGLDIGSRTVPEIAVSIVAELIACRNAGAAEARPRPRVPADTAGT
jgi:xanthine dehydrogenase accessory factor